MRCTACGVEVPDKSQFCLKCGTSFTDARTTAEVAATTPRVPSGRRELEPETDIWSGGFSPRAMMGTWILLGILSLGLLAGGIMSREKQALAGVVIAIFLIWLAAFGLFAYRRFSLRYRLTNQRLFHSRGILTRITDRIELLDVDDVTFEQGIIERIFHVGSIKVSSSDRTHPQLVLRGIDNVRDIANKLDDLRRQERRRYGMHIEAI